MKRALLDLNSNELKEISRCARTSTDNLSEEKMNILWNNYICEVVKKYNTREEIDEKN